MRHRTGQRADPVGSQISPGEHGCNARYPARRIDTDFDDAGMGMDRANDDAMQCVRRRQIGDVAPVAAHETCVFEAVDAAPKQEFGHVRLYGTGPPAVQ